MRIALITDGVWPYVLGGMQKHSYYLCKYLAQQKVFIDLVHFNRSSYDIASLDVFTEEEKKYITSYIVDFPKSLPFPGHYIYNSYKHSQLIFDLLKDKLHTYDLIYTKGFTGWHLIKQKRNGAVSCARIGVKFHGYEMFQKPPDFKIKLQHIFLLRRPVRNLSQQADLVFSYGGRITELIKSIGVNEKNIIELPSGVEASTIAQNVKPVGEKIRFVFLGRYERRKGIEELNTAIRTFLSPETQTKVEFHFIGPIPEEKRLKKEGVMYHGEIRDKAQLQEKMRQMDILVCPSWSEGMPNVILEAMANGLAVIATDVGANNVLVNSSTGWILKSPEPQEIAALLNTLLKEDHAAILRKKQNALDHIAQGFTWETLIKEFLVKIS